jgi:hypothetical protein
MAKTDALLDIMPLGCGVISTKGTFYYSFRMISILFGLKTDYDWDLGQTGA